MNYQSKSLVSCIVTTKNRASYFLERALNSILNQTYQNTELIIINDASNDDTKSFLEKISKMHLGYRTVFTWYMWRSIDPTDVEY